MSKMTKEQALAAAEKINDLTLRQQVLLDELWLLAREASELRIQTMIFICASSKG